MKTAMIPRENWVTIGLVLLANLIFHITALLSSDVKWTHSLLLETGFSVKWDSEDPDFLVMEISAPTTGYLGIGFSPNGDMHDSDIAIAWVDSYGIPHLKDYHGIGKTSPVEDVQQDYFLIAASERDNLTTVRFHRRWETCDEQHDIKIGNDTMRLIWAWHPQDPQLNASLNFPWHGISTRGTKNVFMRLPSKPMVFPDGDDGMNELPPHMKYWDLALENVDIDGSENTLFTCKMFKFNNPMHLRYQMIGFRPILTEENEEFIHQISIYQCDFPSEIDDTGKTLMKDANGKTMECLAHDESSSLFRHCKTRFISWGLGSEGEMFPSHVGVPIEDERGNPTTYFKLQVHYDNLFGKQFLDSSGIRIFYTNQPRLYDGGLLKVGHKTSPFLAIPPSQESFRVYSLCSKDCIRRGIPESGLNIVSVMLHSHSKANKIRLRHIRHGKELSPVTEDNNYTYHFQQYRILKNEARVLPGDELLLECEYNTLEQDKFTFGGYSADEEMCQALLFYYPRANLVSCDSKIEFQSFFAGFGIRNVMGEGLKRIPMDRSIRHASDLIPPQFELEFFKKTASGEDEERNNPFDKVFVTEPISRTNVSVGDRMKLTDWRQRHVSKNLENSWKTGRYFLFCDGRNEIPYEKFVDTIPKFQKYKKLPSTMCRREMQRNFSQMRKANLLLVILIAVITFAFK